MAPKRRTLTGRREKKKRCTEARVRYEQEKPFQIKYRCAVADDISNVSPFNLGQLDNECSYCSALYFSCEKNSAGYFGLCCCNKTFELPSNIITKEDIYFEIFGKGFQSLDDVLNFSNFAILAPKNEHCNEINSKVLDLILGTARTYISVNNLITKDNNEML